MFVLNKLEGNNVRLFELDEDWEEKETVVGEKEVKDADTEKVLVEVVIIFKEEEEEEEEEEVVPKANGKLLLLVEYNVWIEFEFELEFEVELNVK